MAKPCHDGGLHEDGTQLGAPAGLRDRRRKQELLLQNEYLAAENRILRAHLPARLRLSNPERGTLAEIGKRVGSKAVIKIHNGMTLTLMLPVLALLFSSKGEVNVSFVLVLVPIVVLLAIAISRKGWFAMEETARQITRIEDKIYRIHGYPVLAHETELM
jgi:hypothetical protein